MILVSQGRVSEAVAFLLYLWCAALGNVAGDYNSDFGSPRVLTTNRGKVIDQWDANPWKEDMSQKVKGSNPIAGKGFFDGKISGKEYLHNGVVAGFVHNINVSWELMLHITADVNWIWVRTFLKYLSRTVSLETEKLVGPELKVFFPSEKITALSICT